MLSAASGRGGGGNVRMRCSCMHRHKYTAGLALSRESALASTCVRLRQTRWWQDGPGKGMRAYNVLNCAALYLQIKLLSTAHCFCMPCVDGLYKVKR